MGWGVRVEDLGLLPVDSAKPYTPKPQTGLTTRMALIKNPSKNIPKYAPLKPNSGKYPKRPPSKLNPWFLVGNEGSRALDRPFKGFFVIPSVPRSLLRASQTSLGFRAWGLSGHRAFKVRGFGVYP